MVPSQQNHCVISLATNRRQYPQGLKRLQLSLKKAGFQGKFICWPPGEFPEKCPNHFESPFAFKPFCFLEARKMGFDSILWCDSSCVIIRPLKPAFDKIEQEGHVIFKSRAYTVGQWCSDEALRIFNMDREEALRLPEVLTGVIGFNMRNKTAVEFLNQWHEIASQGLAFRGIQELYKDWNDYHDIKWNHTRRASKDPRVRGHRHEQSVAGILAHRLGMRLSSEGLHYMHDTRDRKVVSNKSIFLISHDVVCSNIKLTTLNEIMLYRYASDIRGLFSMIKNVLKRILGGQNG